MATFADPLDHILASPSKVRLLRMFTTLEKPVSARMAARLARVSQRPALRSLQDLANLGVLIREKTSNEHLFQLNRENFLVTQGLSPLFTAEGRMSSGVLVTLREALIEKRGALLMEGAALFDLPGEQEGVSQNELTLFVATRAESDKAHVYERLARPEKELAASYGVDLAVAIETTDRLRELYKTGDPLAVRAVEIGIPVAGYTLKELVLGPANGAEGGQDEAAIPQAGPAGEGSQPWIVKRISGFRFGKAKKTEQAAGTKK